MFIFSLFTQSIVGGFKQPFHVTAILVGAQAKSLIALIFLFFISLFSNTTFLSHTINSCQYLGCLFFSCLPTNYNYYYCYHHKQYP